MIVFVNGDFLPEEKASLGIGDLAIQRGYGVFDFLRTRRNVPLFIDDYLDRFFRSAEKMFLQPSYSQGQVKSFIYELLEMNAVPESGIRMIMTGGYSINGYHPAVPNLVIIQQPLTIPGADTFSRGAKLITHEYQRDLPSVKSINYLMGVWLQNVAEAQKADDVLYHKEGIISELPRANIWMVTRDEKIVTPANNILHGITRMKLLEIASTKFSVEVRDITLDEIRNAAEVFVSSTTKRLMPIVEIDGQAIGSPKPGPITTTLYNDFVAFEEKTLAAYV